MSYKRLMIDGDIFRYEIGAVCQTPEQHFGVTVMIPRKREFVLERVNMMIERIVEATDADSFELFLSGKTNYRNEIAITNPYKGQRSKEKPYHWSTVGEILVESYGAYTVHGAEADDAISIFARLDPDNTVVASRDKDLRIIPCYHYAWRCGESQPEIPVHKVNLIGEIRAVPYPSGGYKLVGNGLRFFYGQVLCGDSVDNYKGCPNVGPVAAVKLLGTCNTEQELYEATLRAFTQKLGPEVGYNLLVENARLAWLLDDAEVTQDADNNIYISPKCLWEPPQALPTGLGVGTLPIEPEQQCWSPLPEGLCGRAEGVDLPSAT